LLAPTIVSSEYGKFHCSHSVISEIGNSHRAQSYRLCRLLQGSYTGGLQNPAIAMGPSVASGNFQDHFVSTRHVECIQSNSTNRVSAPFTSVTYHNTSGMGLRTVGGLHSATAQPWMLCELDAIASGRLACKWNNAQSQVPS